MNRLIKYRQPLFDSNGKLQEWHYWGFGIEQGGEIADVYPLTFKLGICDPKQSLQYTGLKDKNGQEIYDGDILSLNELILPVTFYNGSFHIIGNPNQGASPLIQDRAKNFVIIGNIYENPNLL